MEPDVPTLILLIAAGASITAASLFASRVNRPLWLLDPRGPFALLLFLNSCGLIIYRLIYGAYPLKFGLVPSLIEPATWSLIGLQLGVLFGTLLPVRNKPTSRLELDPSSFSAYRFVLILATIFLAALRQIKFFLYEAATLSQRYGAGQWEREHDIVYLNPSALAVPCAMLLLIAWAQSGLSFRRPLIISLTVAAVLPSLLTGGRRDLILVVLGLAVASAVRNRRFSIRRFAVLGLVLVALSLALEASRRGESLTLADRAESFADSSDQFSVLEHGLRMFVGTNLQTAVMTIFPDHENFALGRTYLGAAVNALFPRFIFGRYIAEPAGLHFKDLFYRDVEGMGLDYSLAAEAYQNFGPLGPAIAGIILGAMLAYSFSRASTRSSPYSLWPSLHLMIFSSSLWIIRTDSNGAAKLLLYSTGLVLTLAFIATKLRRTKVHRPKSFSTQNRFKWGGRKDADVLSN